MCFFIIFFVYIFFFYASVIVFIEQFSDGKLWTRMELEMKQEKWKNKKNRLTHPFGSKISSFSHPSILYIIERFSDVKLWTRTEFETKRETKKYKKWINLSSSWESIFHQFCLSLSISATWNFELERNLRRKEKHGGIKGAN